MPSYSARMSSKGQFVLPAEVREALDIKEGDRLEFFLSNSGRLSLFTRNRPLSRIFGLGSGAPAVAEEERETSIGNEIAARGRSKRAERAA